MMKPYFQFIDGISRRNGWILGEEKGRMVVGVTTSDGNKRSILVDDFADTTGQLVLRFWCQVGPVGRVPADQAMKINIQLPHAALADRDGIVVITATRMMQFANPSEVSLLLASMATFAQFYARHYGCP